MNQKYKLHLLIWLQFILIWLLCFFILFWLSSCKCGLIQHDTLFFCGCGIGTEPLAVLVSEPNRLEVNYRSIPQEASILTPYGTIQTHNQKGD